MRNTVLVRNPHINWGRMTTGQFYWAGSVASFFAMIKKEKGRFKNNPNWGKGSGWVLGIV